MADYEIFALGNVVLQSGLTLRNAQLAYKTYGTLNSRKDNAIVYPTFYGGQHAQNAPMIGPGMALDPADTSSSFPTCSAMACPPHRATPHHHTIERASHQ